MHLPPLKNVMVNVFEKSDSELYHGCPTMHNIYLSLQLVVYQYTLLQRNMNISSSNTIASLG